MIFKSMAMSPTNPTAHIYIFFKNLFCKNSITQTKIIIIKIHNENQDIQSTHWITHHQIRVNEVK